ncbi:gamma-butyrobetaine hydroxylase-like domain-containing protein [Thalassotalea nanhaiensis]|uniref:Gamma-butyrobetaine hydroxylase-like domain-containing protein n=1 Tax=Thalassotalea nanhaiensis TaxID=3065648 RepID=A0ABY9TK68_9GAMM|nr:gamma-butyrobetaine hydroxylase-like domain-containing protein [Colwelliaceae bacterium SQ345]
MQITQLVLNEQTNLLTLSFADNFSQSLSYEFMRVYSPNEQTSKKGQAKAPVSHKKMVKLLAIEPLAKHGFRLIFDDQHSAIYSAQLLQEYAHNKARLWQEYIDALALTGHSREAMIDITQIQ